LASPAQAQVVCSPDAELVAVPYVAPGVYLVNVVTAKRHADGTHLETVYSFRSPQNHRHRGAFPVISFSRARSFVVGFPDGSVQHYISGAKQAVWSFTTAGKTPVLGISSSADGAFIAVAVGAKSVESIELYSVKQRQGVRINLPVNGDGQAYTLKNLIFSPDGSRLLINLLDTAIAAEINADTSKIYVLDVFRSLAALPRD